MEQAAEAMLPMIEWAYIDFHSMTHSGLHKIDWRWHIHLQLIGLENCIDRLGTYNAPWRQSQVVEGSHGRCRDTGLRLPDEQSIAD